MPRQVEPGRHPRKPRTSKATCVYGSVPTLRAHKGLAQCLRRPLDHDQRACWFADLPQWREALQKASAGSDSELISTVCHARPLDPNRCHNGVMPGRAIFAVVAAAALFGTTGTARALGPDGTSVWTVGAIRIALGAITLWACSPSKQLQPAMTGVNRNLVLCGAFGAALYQPAFFWCRTFRRCSWNCHRTRKRPDVLRPHRSRTTPKTPGHEVVHRHCSHACRSCSSRCRGANDSSEISLSLFGMLSAMAAGLGYAVYAHTTSVLISQEWGQPRLSLPSLLSPHSYSVRSLSLQSSRAVMSVGCGRRVA